MAEAKTEPVGMYDEPHGTPHAVICTCGWRKGHPRAKVRAAAAERHTAKTGHGWYPGREAD